MGFRRPGLALMAGLLVLSACSPQGGRSPSTDASDGLGGVTTTTSNLSTTTKPTAGAKEDPEVAPITGYGDFSGITWFEIDPVVIVGLIARCMRDHGFPVLLVPPGDGISLVDVPLEHNALAGVYRDACYKGLNVPSDQVPATREQAEKAFHYQLALVECLVERGYTRSEPPSLEAYVDAYISNGNVWVPYTVVGSPPDDLLFECPQSPPGGYGGWEIGDGIKPMPPMLELPPVGSLP